jgi:hypothetical protein
LFQRPYGADVSTAQFARVMPQSLTPEWERELGPQAREHWARLLHTLGHITLTGYNQEMGNRPYAEKRDAFAGSHFELNRYFANITSWTADAIEARGQALTKLALTIWRDLVRAGSPQPAGLRFERKPVAVRFRNQEEPVSNWKQAALKLIEWFEAASPGLLAELERKQVITSVLSIDATRFARSRGQFGGVYVQMHGSAKTLRTYVKWIAQGAHIGEAEYEFVMPDVSR